MATATTARRTRTVAPKGTAKTVLAKTPAVVPAPEKPEAKVSSMEIAAHLSPGRMAIATLTPERLKALAFVSTYSTEDPQSTSKRGHGYQREPMEERFPGIGRYYAKNDNRHRIPALIASVRIYDAKARGRFNTLFNQGSISKIHQEFGKSVFSMVDGQHRMGGLYWAWEKLDDFNANVPVMLYYGLTYAEEAALFDDINTNQRKLPKALIEATKVHTEAGSPSHEQRLREVAFALAEDGDSVWRDKVNMTGAKSAMPMSYEGIRRSTGSLFSTRILGRLEDRGFYPEDVAKRFWELVSKACHPAWVNEPRWVENESQELVEEPVKYRLKDVVGVSAISKLGADIINTALDKSKNEEEFWDVMAEYVSKLGEVDWEKRRNNPYMATSAGFGGQGQLYEILYNLVYLGKAPGIPAAVEEK
jgi:DGQHR domain-containing protein